MFEGPAGIDVTSMLRQLQDAQDRLADFRREHDELRVVGVSDDGLVTVTVDGSARVIDVEVRPTALRGTSVTIAEAFRSAVDAAYARHAEEADRIGRSAVGDEAMYRQVQDGSFDMYEYLEGFGLRMPEIRESIRRATRG